MRCRRPDTRQRRSTRANNSSIKKPPCQSCHIVDTKTDKGYVGPTLTQVGSRLTASWMFHWLKNPQALRPSTVEPNRNMSDEDAQALTAYLTTLKSGKAATKSAEHLSKHATLEARK